MLPYRKGEATAGRAGEEAGKRKEHERFYAGGSAERY